MENKAHGDANGLEGRRVVTPKGNGVVVDFMTRELPLRREYLVKLDAYADQAEYGGTWIAEDNVTVIPEEPKLTRASVGDVAIETQQSIAEWANRTFGPAPSLARIAARANEEMAELLRAATADRSSLVLVEEAADVVIVLYRLAHASGYDLDAMVDAKMRENRTRDWKVDGTGHGYHVREK